MPLEDSAADETFDGAALVFPVPFRAIDERPVVFEFGDPEGDETARVQLDV